MATINKLLKKTINRIVFSFLLVAFSFHAVNANSASFQVNFFGDIAISDLSQFRTRQCDSSLNLGATFYSIASENEAIPKFSLIDNYPGTSFIAGRVGLESYGKNGICLEQYSAWRFGNFGPQIYYNLEYTFSPSWSKKISYDVLATSIGIEQSFLQSSDWFGSAFLSFHNYYSVKPEKISSSVLIISKSNERFIETGAILAYQANPGFRYELELIYQYGFSNFDDNSSIRAYADNFTNVYKVAFNSITALGKARTPAAQFAITVNALTQFTENNLPFYQSCRSGRGGFTFLHAVDYYLADVCAGLHTGLRYAQDWSLINNMYVELATDYLIGNFIIGPDAIQTDKVNTWSNLLVSIAIVTKPFELSDVGGKLLIGYPILGSGSKNDFSDKLNFSFNLNFNF